MKNNLFNFSYLLLSFLFITSCSQTQDVGQNNSGEWLIPTSSVFDGGPGKDGIPSIDNPTYVTASEVNYMDDNDLVIAIKSGDEIKAYTHPVLDWHEIVNDEIGDIKYALTYCPLTGTGIGWNRVINGQTTTFGVSGKLFNTNLMPFDRQTESYWSQLRLDCVTGELINEKSDNIMFFETTWKTWISLYPNAPIISTNTGFNRNYNQYPYGEYKTDNSLLFFPVDNQSNALPQKERVLSLYLNDITKVYTFDSFSESRVNVITDIVDGQNIIVVGSKEDNFMAAFSNPSNISFEAVVDNYPVVLKDTEGNEWDVFGIAVSGPRKGQKLEKPTSMMAYWFAVVAFYPDVVIY